MQTFLTVVLVVTVVVMTLLILVQSGKGAEVSASFGGSSQTIFGSSGGANFFQKLTGVLAAIFMLSSLGLTILKNKERESVFADAPAAETSAPAATPDNTPATESAPAPTEAPAK